MAGIDEQRGLLGDRDPVIDAVIGDDCDAIGRGYGRVEIGLGAEAHAVVAELRDVGIVIADVGALVLEQLDDVKRGRLADVVDILLVGDPEQEDAAPLERLAGQVEAVLDLLDPVGGHTAVDLAG